VLSVVDANPDYLPVLHSVRRWLVEFDIEGRACRELGIGGTGDPVLAGPDKRNYGYWPDTNVAIDELDGERISEALFEALWRQFYDAHPDREDHSLRSNLTLQRAAPPPLN
jgi:hypothetical protein